jgi:hypothetical protein
MPQRAPVHQHISCMGMLNDYVRHPPTLKDSHKAVATTKKWNIPFSKADLAAIILASVPMLWQNQYNLTHLTVPESPHTLLLDLENTKCIIVEKFNERLKAKGKATVVIPIKRVIARGKCLGAQVIKSLRRHAVRSSASVARLTAAYQTHTTGNCRCNYKDG